MLNSYLRTLKFEIDKFKNTKNHIILAYEENANLEEFVLAQGNTFDELWNYIEQNELVFFGHREDIWFLSRKRRIEFDYFSDIPTWVDNGTKKEWKVSIIDKPYKVTMKELMKQDADDVIQYFKDRGISSMDINL